MRARCEDPGASSYSHYGARGIRVCERWRSFDRFYEDMAPEFAKGLSIERRDVNADSFASKLLLDTQGGSGKKYP